jgi:hypothetical protein
MSPEAEQTPHETVIAVKVAPGLTAGLIGGAAPAIAGRRRVGADDEDGVGCVGAVPALPVFAEAVAAGVEDAPPGVGCARDWGAGAGVWLPTASGAAMVRRQTMTHARAARNERVFMVFPFPTTFTCSQSAKIRDSVPHEEIGCQISCLTNVM